MSIRTIAIAATVALTATLAVPASAMDGHAPRPSEIEMQNRVAKDLQTARAPATLRTRIISTLGLGIGTAVGEVSTSVVTCIAEACGVKTNYKPGDMSKQSWKALKTLWGVKDDEPRRAPTPAAEPATRRTSNNGLGTHMGYQAVMGR